MHIVIWGLCRFLKLDSHNPSLCGFLLFSEIATVVFSSYICLEYNLGWGHTHLVCCVYTLSSRIFTLQWFTPKFSGSLFLTFFWNAAVPPLLVIWQSPEVKTQCRESFIKALLDSDVLCAAWKSADGTVARFDLSLGEIGQQALRRFVALWKVNQLHLQCFEFLIYAHSHSFKLNHAVLVEWKA